MNLLKLIPEIKKQVYTLKRKIEYKYLLKLNKEATFTTKQGIFTIPTGVPDPISRSLYLNKEFELDLITETMHLIRNLRNLEKGQGTILDIGANNGVISIGMLVRGELNKAIAIEPEPRNFLTLTHNVQQNDLDNVMICLNYAVSNEKSTLEFELSEKNYGDHRVRKSFSETKSKERFDELKREVITVEADSIDNLLANLDQKFTKDISVIWVDVQGYEGYVFLGSKQLLSSGIPLVSEIWPYGIMRAGMSQETFCEIVSNLWNFYWVKRRGKFIKYPINIFYTYFEELGYNGDYDNVIFTQ